MNSRANAGKLFAVGVLVLLGAIVFKPNVAAAHSYSTGNRSNVSSWNKYDKKTNQPTKPSDSQSDTQNQQTTAPAVDTPQEVVTQPTTPVVESVAQTYSQNKGKDDDQKPCPPKVEEQPKEKPCPKPVENPKPCPKPEQPKPEHKPCPAPVEHKKPCPKHHDHKHCPVHHKPCPPVKTPCPEQPPVTPPVTPPEEGGKGGGPVPETPIVAAAAVTPAPATLADTGTNSVAISIFASVFVAAAAFVATRRTKVSE